MTTPVVSVIMPVYNGEEYIAEAIRSILEQTLSDFELIVVTEFGSSAASIAEVEKFSDPRIIHIKNTEKLGLIASLNIGLKLAKGKYIARMDSDDVSLPTRLEKQVSFLDAHPDVGMLGTRVWYIDGDGKKTYKPRYYSEPGSLAWDLFFNSPVPHPTAMMRRELVTELNGYDPNARLVEDYDLWIRASRATKIANLAEELVLIRKHGENITVARREEQGRAAARLACVEMGRLLKRDVSENEVWGLRNPSMLVNGDEALKAADLLNELYSRYVSTHQQSRQEKADVSAYMIRLYSVLVSIGMKRGWGITSKLLSKSSMVGMSKMKILAQGLVRRVIR